MTNLFPDTRFNAYGEKIIEISGHLADMFKNEHKTNSNSLLKICSIVQDLYTGAFAKYFVPLDHKGEYDMHNVSVVLGKCVNDYDSIKSMLDTCYNHLQVAKGKSYLPWNKKWLEGLTAYTFMRSFNRDANRYENPFCYFINTPKQQQSYYQQKLVDRYREHLLSMNCQRTVEFAEKFSEKFETQKSKWLYWLSIDNMMTWWDCMKTNFPNITMNLKAQFTQSLLLADYTEWLGNLLRDKEGERFHYETYEFIIFDSESSRLKGFFASYVKTRLIKICPDIKDMPKDICSYGTPETFVKIEKSSKDSNAKMTEQQWNIVGYCELHGDEGRYDTLMSFMKEYASTITSEDIDMLFNMVKFSPGAPSRDAIVDKIEELKNL